MTKETKTKNIYQRIHAVMEKVDYVQKERKSSMPYASVSHDKVTAAIRPHLVMEGVIYFPQNLKYAQDGNRTEVTLDLVFVCADNPDDKLVVPTFGYGIDSQDKGPGKAVSYAIKYALLKTFGLETGDDADNESIEHKPKEAPKATPQEAPVFKNSDERMDWLHSAGKAVEKLKTPEEIMSWEQDNDTKINALGEKQKGWLEDLLAQQRAKTYQAPIGEKNGTTAHH